MNCKNTKAMDTLEKLRFSSKIFKARKIVNILFVIGVCIFFTSFYFIYQKKTETVLFLLFLASVLIIPSRFFDFLRVRETLLAPIILVSCLSLILLLFGCVIFFFRR